MTLALEQRNRVSAPSTSNLGNTLTAESTALINDRVTMKNIAQQTGGEAFVNTNDLKRVIARSLEDGSTYYTLAYTPPKEDAGGYHKVAGCSAEQELEAGVPPRLLQHSTGDGFGSGRNCRVAHCAAAGHASVHFHAADGFAGVARCQRARK